MVKWFSGDVLANGINIHYCRTGGEKGNDKPLLVLSHGFSDNGLCWSRVASALESEYDIIIPDDSKDSLFSFSIGLSYQ